MNEVVNMVNQTFGGRLGTLPGIIFIFIIGYLIAKTFSSIALKIFNKIELNKKLNSSTSESLDAEDNVANDEFIGAWNWTNIDDSFGKNIHDTPVSTEKTVQLNLMKNNQFTIVENGTQQSSGTYSITLEKSIHSGEMDNFINFDNDFKDGVIRKNETNQLTIADNYPDGTTMTFLKK